MKNFIFKCLDENLKQKSYGNLFIQTYFIIALMFFFWIKLFNYDILLLFIFIKNMNLL